MDEDKRNSAKAGRRMLLATALLVLLACGFCGGWFAAVRSGVGDGYTVSAETRALPPMGEEEAGVSAAAELIDINRADAEALQSLNGIGEALAERIVAYREEHGPFRETYEIMAVSGIGPGTYERIREWICVGENE